MFIYVKDGDSRDWFLGHGFQILKNDDENNNYIFVNNSDLFFEDMSAISYAVSDVLTF